MRQSFVTSSRSSLRETSHRHESGTVCNFHVIVKKISKFDHRRTDECLEWHSKLRASLRVYNETIFNVLKGQERPSEVDADQETTRATWDVANQDLYSMHFFNTASSAFSVVRRFQGKTSAGGAEQGQQAWTALHHKFNGCSRAAIRAEHIRMISTRMRPGQDPDDYCNHMDSCRDRLNAGDPPEGPTDRQYGDIILQTLSSEYNRVRQTHLERRDFDLADIRRIMTAIYADNTCSVQNDQNASWDAAPQCRR